MRSEAINVAVAEPTLLTTSQNIYAFSEAIKSDANVNLCDDNQVQPIFIRKQPKFPTRERHLAIRRKKSYLANMNLTSCNGSKTNNNIGSNGTGSGGCGNTKCEK